MRNLHLSLTDNRWPEARTFQQGRDSTYLNPFEHLHDTSGIHHASSGFSWKIKKKTSRLFYAKIGPKLAKNICLTKGKSYKKFMNAKCNLDFKFVSTGINENTIKEIIGKLNKFCMSSYHYHYLRLYTVIQIAEGQKRGSVHKK